MFEDSYYERNAAPNEASSIKRNVLDSYKFKNVAEGGIVGLQQGGMATSEAPSAMSAMLAPPMQQQPMPMQQQPMPMQQQPMPMQTTNGKVCLCRVWDSLNLKVFNLFLTNL
jgi:hypothetical protein